jgi:hypothetical protein
MVAARLATVTVRTSMGLTGWRGSVAPAITERGAFSIEDQIVQHPKEIGQRLVRHEVLEPAHPKPGILEDVLGLLACTGAKQEHEQAGTMMLEETDETVGPYIILDLVHARSCPIDRPLRSMRGRWPK